jgi:hypothetical protein
MVFVFLLGLVQALASSEVPWFNHGVRSIEVGPVQTSELSAQSCKDCHKREFEDWSQSRHSQAWSNPVFQEGFLLEPSDRCIYCHAPLSQQLDEIRSRRQPSLSPEGVNCVTCHMRNGEIYSSRGSGSGYHPYSKDLSLKSPQFCAGCHQFNFNKTINGQMFLSNNSIQNTYEEWNQYRKKGGTKTCQECHMTQGRHTFQGAHSPQMVRKAIQLTIRTSEHFADISLKAGEVGHLIPTGDLFRHITLEVSDLKGGSFKTVQTFGKRYELTLDPLSGNLEQKLTSDTTFKSGETKKVRITRPFPFRYRLVYHFTSPENERRSHLPPALQSQILFSGVVKNYISN